jgi:ABC-type nitrate/sulfonate/bicarbonate transport system substrate-binding protein
MKPTTRLKLLGRVKVLMPLVTAGIVATVLGLSACQRDTVGKLESITVGYSPFEATALFWIAEDRRFFSQNSLNPIPHKFDTGADALDGMLKGEVNIVIGTSEFPLVGRAFRKEKMRIIGNADKAEFINLVGRKDRGIEKVSDLKGKRVGTTFGTVAHFHLARFLHLHRLDMQDITLVDVRTPEEWVNAVADGDIDAIATAQPYANSAKDRLGPNAIFWLAQSGQPLHGLIIASDEWITKHPEPAERFLRSLAQAEQYVVDHRAEAKRIVQNRLNLDSAYIETVWAQNQFSLSLDQALIATMEDEARWMIKNGLTAEKEVPDFLEYVYTKGLEAVKPGAVNIIR